MEQIRTGSVKKHPGRLLEVRDLSFVREGKSIIERVSWDVLPGENWVLFGRNGAGKTMLLELLTGYLQSSGGTIKRFGKGYGESSIREIRKRIGYISTPLSSMIPEFEPLIDVVIGGVDASAGLWRKPKREELEQAEFLLSEIGMESRSRDPFRILSDGERQKVLMLRAMINDPDVLILDEPTKGLDLTSREELLSAMKSLFKGKRNVSIIYVTHHTDEIISIFDKIHILDRGKSLYLGGVDKGLRPDLLEKIFQREIEVVKMAGRYYTILKNQS